MPSGSGPWPGLGHVGSWLAQPWRGTIDLFQRHQAGEGLAARQGAGPTARATVCVRFAPCHPAGPRTSRPPPVRASGAALGREGLHEPGLGRSCGAGARALMGNAAKRFSLGLLRAGIRSDSPASPGSRFPPRPDGATSETVIALAEPFQITFPGTCFGAKKPGIGVDASPVRQVPPPADSCIQISIYAPLYSNPKPGYHAHHGEVAEWSKAHAWKVCRRETVSRVRIPVSPPPSPLRTRSGRSPEAEFLLFSKVFAGWMRTSETRVRGDFRL